MLGKKEGHGSSQGSQTGAEKVGPEGSVAAEREKAESLAEKSVKRLPRGVGHAQDRPCKGELPCVIPMDGWTEREEEQLEDHDEDGQGGYVS